MPKSVRNTSSSTKLAPSEEKITEAICTFLTLFNNNAQLNRIAPSGFFKGGVMRKHVSKFIKRGVSDVQYISNSHFFAFEVKTPKEYKYAMKHYREILNTPTELLNKKKKHLQEQIFYLEGVKANGFTGLFVCSVEMVRDVLKAKRPSLAHEKID